MGYLFELMRMPSGESRTVLDTTSTSPRASFKWLLGDNFYEGTVMSSVREIRPGADMRAFREAYRYAHGGDWREVKPGVWLHEPNDDVR